MLVIPRDYKNQKEVFKINKEKKQYIKKHKTCKYLRSLVPSKFDIKSFPGIISEITAPGTPLYLTTAPCGLEDCLLEAETLLDFKDPFISDDLLINKCFYKQNLFVGQDLPITLLIKFYKYIKADSEKYYLLN